MKYYLVILLVLVGALKLFFSFSEEVTKDLVWYNNSDQNIWCIYTTLDFNDGKPSNFITHPGVGVNFTYGLGYKLLKFIGSIKTDKTSDFKNLEDPISYIPIVYKHGILLSKVLVLLCSILIGLIVYIITSNYYISFYGLISTYLSGGFLYHSVMLRTELSAIFYLLLGMCFFMLTYKEKSKNYSFLLLFISGFFLGISYFTKTQVSFLIIILFLFILRHNFIQNRIYLFNKKLTVVCFLLQLILTLSLVCFFKFYAIPSYWLFIIVFLVLANLISQLNTFYLTKQNWFLSSATLVSVIGLGFSFSFLYIFIRALHGNDILGINILEYTSLWGTSNTGMIDESFGRIIIRFFFCIKQYFLESSFVICGILAVYQLTKREKKYTILFGVMLIVCLCLINSLRVAYKINATRTVFQYLIFSDVPVIILLSATYSYVLSVVKEHKIIHLLFWILLIIGGLKNYYKMPKDIAWGFTSYPYLIYSEIWYPTELRPELMSILENYYRGHYNAYDRGVLGNEISRKLGNTPRTNGPGKVYMPWVNTTHEISIKHYLMKIDELDFRDRLIGNKVRDIEDGLFKYKLSLFRKGDDYQNIVEQIKEKRIQTYKTKLPLEYSTILIDLLDEKELTVPF